MFRSNVPASGDAFLDRRKEMAQLEGLVKRLSVGEPSWLAILGLRKIGKTSLLLELARRAESTSVFFVILDSFEVSPMSPAIFRRYALRTLDAVLSREIGVSLEAMAADPAGFRSALQTSQRFASLKPALRGRILELPQRDPDAAFQEQALRLPEELAEGLGIRGIVAWDEFQELGRLGSGRESGDPFRVMRSVWQRHRRIAYVVSGSQRTALTELMSEERSPFFQHFSLMELGRFGRQEGVELLTQGAPADRPIPESVAEQAVDLLGGHPFYLQMLGEVLTASAPPYDERNLKEALQELLFSRTGRLSLYFENVYERMVGRSAQLAATLQAAAGEPGRLTDIANAIGASTASTAKYLERLGDAVTRRDDGLYTMSDGTLALWLRWRQPGGSVVPMTAIGDEAEKAVAGRLAAMGFDLVYQSRGSRGAFDLLATRGSVQLAIQVKRMRLPLRFSRIAWNRMAAEAERFGWKWIIAAVEPPPSDSVVLLDPAKARVAGEVRIGEGAVVDNVLMWLDKPERSPSKTRRRAR